VFDTGAEYSFMGFGGFVKKNGLLEGEKPAGRWGSTVSMGLTTRVYECIAAEFGFGATIRAGNVPVSLQDPDAVRSWDPLVDGSAGILMISRYNFTVNLLEKEIHFFERRLP